MISVPQTLICCFKYTNAAQNPPPPLAHPCNPGTKGPYPSHVPCLAPLAPLGTAPGRAKGYAPCPHKRSSWSRSGPFQEKWGLGLCRAAHRVSLDHIHGKQREDVVIVCTSEDYLYNHIHYEFEAIHQFYTCIFKTSTDSSGSVCMYKEILVSALL